MAARKKKTAEAVTEPGRGVYAPDPLIAGNPHKVSNGDTHTIDSGIFTPYDLVIIPEIQRGHGPNTAAWARSRKLFNNWDPGKVLTLDVAKILLLEDTEVLRLGLDGTVESEVLPKGTIVYHTMDGGHRLSAVWYAHMTSEDPEPSVGNYTGHLYTRKDVADTLFVANVYEWPKAKVKDDLIAAVSKYFIAKNRERNAVSKSDQLKMRVNQGDENALRIESAVRDIGLSFPYELDYLKASGEVKEASKLGKEGKVVTAVGATEAVFNFFGANGKDFRTMPSSVAERDNASKGLKLVLAMANVIYTSEDMVNARVKANNRWLGDWLMGLARLVETNPEFVNLLLTPPGPGGTYPRTTSDALARIRRHQVMGKFGPDAWKATASIIAGEYGSTMGSNEVIRSYWMALALTESYNKAKRTGKLNAPKPIRMMEVETEDILDAIDADDDAA